jgi:hypothetical protein
VHRLGQWRKTADHLGKRANHRATRLRFDTPSRTEEAIMRKMPPLLAAALLLAHAAASADPTYRLGDDGICNKGTQRVRIHYSPANPYANFHDIEVDGITKHASGDALEPGDCATMMFKVGPGFPGADPTRSTMFFHADDRACEVRFSAVVHRVWTDEGRCGDGLVVRHHGEGDTFQIDVSLN